MQETIENFKSHRKRTLDLIDCLAENDLDFAPYPSVTPFWKQFIHLGGVQEEYLEAVGTGKIQFRGDASSSYQGGKSKVGIREYLSSLDRRLELIFREAKTNTQIDWFGEKISLRQHFHRMLEHEMLHHGEWVVFMKVLGKSFPKSWSVWGF